MHQNLLKTIAMKLIKRNSLSFCILAVLSVMFLTNCNSSRGTISEVDRASTQANKESRRIDNPANRDLVDVLRGIPGLDITGSGATVNITIRGAKTIQGDNSPLFVVDGTPVGTDFSSLQNTLNPQDVGSVRVLTGAQAGIYGARGANGVVVIKTK